MSDKNIPPLPWTIEVGDARLLIGSEDTEEPGRVDEIVFSMDYEDGGGINREIEMARAKFIVEAVNRLRR
jgi:hypothetical protein